MSDKFTILKLYCVNCGAYQTVELREPLTMRHFIKCFYCGMNSRAWVRPEHQKKYGYGVLV